MRLIIDIPEEDYKGICHLRNEQLRMLPVEVAETLLQIANGIPLDKIRAEIEQEKIYILKTEDGKEIKASANDVINPDYRNYTSGLNTALQIIDKYKAESEDKE